MRIRCSCPWVQCVVAVTVASVRPFTVAAFAVLVPMYGLGLNGVWAARHGTFGPLGPAPATAESDAESGDDARTPPRRSPRRRLDDDDAVTTDAEEAAAGENDAPDTTEMEQNAGHG